MAPFFLILLIIIRPIDGIVLPKRVSTAVYFGGGNSTQFRRCSSCNALTLEPDFACSSQTVPWNGGLKSFTDPVPVGHSVVQMLFMLTGIFNCNFDPSPSTVTLKVNDVPIVEGYMPLSPQGCYCGNCDISFPIQSRLFARAVDSYNYSGVNLLHVSTPTVICLYKINITLFYVPLLPEVKRVFPVSVPSNGNVVVHLFANHTKEAADILCVFNSTSVVANVTDQSIDCLAPAFGNVSHVSLFIQTNVGVVGLHRDNDVQIKIYPPSIITGLRPAAGSSLGGTSVVIDGGPFDKELANVCMFGSSPVNATVLDSKTIQCITPAGNGLAAVLFLPNGQNPANGTLSFQFEAVANYLYMLMAFVFVVTTVGAAIGVRVWLYRRTMRNRRRAAIAAAGQKPNEQAPLLTSVLDDEYLEQVDADEIQLAERIGKGTYGEVFKGVWRGTVVAVKKLPGHNITPALLVDFVREVRLMKHLRHPNVLQFLGACLTDNHRDLAIIIEYMPRNSLWAVLHDKSLDLLWSLRRAMLGDAARGMNYLHSRRPPIIHRDLKSHNLLVDESWRVKVCDFGLSRIIESSPSLNTMTACGTPCWTAPEVLRSQRYTQKADVYSFGIVVWECAARADPYAGTPPFQVVFAVGNKGLRPTVPEDCPPSIALLMTRCWDENPDLRPPFEEVVTLLHDAEIPPDNPI